MKSMPEDTGENVYTATCQLRPEESFNRRIDVAPADGAMAGLPFEVTVRFQTAPFCSVMRMIGSQIS